MAKKKNDNAIEVQVEAPAATPRGRKAGPTTVLKTATEIGERFGYDVALPVSKKAWLELARKEKLAEIDAAEGF